jgi:hypothetical protein
VPRFLGDVSSEVVTENSNARILSRHATPAPAQVVILRDELRGDSIPSGREETRRAILKFEQ